MSKHRVSSYSWLIAAMILFAPAAAQTGPPVTLDAVGSGELLWKSEGGLIPLPVGETDVVLEVTGVMSHGRVTQSFRNTTDEVIETIYVFPLPERAAVHHMEMRIGDRHIVSEIREKEEAQRIYRQAKANGKKAALVDQRRPNLFVTSAANINPGEVIVVVLEYYAEVDYADGVFSLRFPLTFTPRFVPPQVGRGTADGAAHPTDSVCELGAPEFVTPFVERSHPLSPRARLRLTLRAGFEPQEIVSSSHDVEVERIGERFSVRPQQELIPADRDFRLQWSPRRGEQTSTSLLFEERNDELYAMALIVPPIPGSEAGLGLPTETIFVIDVSGSMSGPSIRQARRALQASLTRLRPEDRFNIVAFSSGHLSFADSLQPADETSLQAAWDWVGALRAGGGTMIEPALLRALQMADLSNSAGARRIVFLTDGAVGNEAEILRGVGEKLGQVRLHTVALGRAPNAYFMRKLAQIGRGICEFISDLGETDNAIDSFFARLDRPVMTDLELEWEGVDVAESYPKVLPDLHAGEPIVVSARLSGAAADVSMRLHGWTRAGPVDVEATNAGQRSDVRGIAVHWARAKVESLMDGLHEGVSPIDVRADVLSLALEHHLVTRYTSLVAVDRTPTANATARTTRLASALPNGGSSAPLTTAIGYALLAAGLTMLLGHRLLRPLD